MRHKIRKMNEQFHGYKNLKFKRPNREQSNKTGWGNYSGGVTEDKVSNVLREDLQIDAGSYKKVKDAADSYSSNIKNMYQLRHANPDMVAVAVYVLFILMEFDPIDPLKVFNEREFLDKEIEEKLDFFLEKTMPIESDKKELDLYAIKWSFKVAIIRYVYAIYFHTIKKGDDIFFKLKPREGETFSTPKKRIKTPKKDQPKLKINEKNQKEQQITRKRGRPRKEKL
jgi:hypothetical protein